MTDFSSIMKSVSQPDSDDETDDYWVSMLAHRLSDNMQTFCILRTFYDGAEVVPTNAIPAGTDVKSFAIYKRFLEMGTVNYARIIVNSVASRQKPIGFRLVDDKISRSTDADTAWYDNRMDLKARQVLHDVALYGSGYLLATYNPVPDTVRVLSPWEAAVSNDGDSGIYYSYDARNGVESIRLYRCVRDEAGVITGVYTRTAVRESDTRSLIDEADVENIYRQCNETDVKAPEISDGFEWEGPRQFDDGGVFAVCGGIPLIRIGSGDGMGQFEPHLRLLMSLDQERFDRFCIQTMQAFRQRAIKGRIPQYYKESDPQVVAGLAKAGDPIDYSDVFAMGPAALWMLPEGAEIWESQITDITPWVTAATNDVKQLAAATGLPLDILSPDVQGSASGADLKREGLIFNVTDLNARANDAFVQVLRMAIAFDKGLTAAESRFETVWAPIMHDSDLNLAQAANYVKDILPARTIMRKFLHMTETEIAEAMQDMNDSAFTSALASVSANSVAADESAANSGLFADSGFDGAVSEPLVTVGSTQSGDVDGSVV